MKKINSYIIEKLRINKNSKVELSNDCKALLKLFTNYKKGSEYLKEWLTKNNVESFEIYINKSKLIYFMKDTYDYKSFKLENSIVREEESFADIIKMSNKILPGGVNAFDKYLIYDNKSNGPDVFSLYGSDKGAILDTFSFEILIVITRL